MSIPLTISHIDLLIRLSDVNLNFNQLSATKQRFASTLVARGLAYPHPMDDDVVAITERGRDLLTHLTDYMNDWMCAT